MICSLKKSSLLVFTILIFLVQSLCAKDIYVWGTNTNTGDGSFENPYKTIQQAANVAQPGDIVNIRAGVYREDISMPTDGVTYQAYQNDIVTINGTEQLKNWTLLPGSQVYKTTMDFSPPGFVSSQFPNNQIFVDQKMIEYARWPDQTSNNLCIPTDAIVENIKVSGNSAVFTVQNFNEPDGRWVGASVFLNLSLSGNDGQGWTGLVTSTNLVRHTITVNFREPPRLEYGPYQMGVGTEFHLFNPTKAGVEATGGVAALLSPGEWWKSDSTVYVRMPNNMAPNSENIGTNIVEAKKRNLIFVANTENINKSGYTIKNINFFACTISTATMPVNNIYQITEDAHDITLDGLNFKYLSHFTDLAGNWQNQWYGNTGVVLSGRNNIIKNCKIQYSAGAGICVMGMGNKVLNNTISEVNYSCSNAGAISTSYICIDGEIAYNDISNTTVMAINFGGLTNSDPNKKGIARIHHNKIYNFLLRSNDSGAIDATGILGNWGRMDHNVIYRTFNPKRNLNAAYGLYFDYNPGEWYIDHNVFYGFREAMHINKAPFLSIYNNTIINKETTQSNITDCCSGGYADTIRNNIFSASSLSGSLSSAVKSNNLFNAVYNSTLFKNTSQNNYELKNIATDAIDKGVGNYTFNDPLIGGVDLGAFEYGAPSWVAGPVQNLPPIIKPSSGDFVDSTQVNIKTDITLPNTVIRYTIDGKQPSLTSPIFTQNFTITDTTLVKAQVFVNNIATGEISQANIFVTSKASIAPILLEFSRESGTYEMATYLAITSPSANVQRIHYTLDGSEPTVASPKYWGTLIIINETQTVKAIAIGQLINSEVKTATYIITGPKVSISPNGGTVNSATAVTLNASLPQSKIYYTLDGTAPTENDYLYTNPISITANTILSAIAVLNNKIGEVATANFVFSDLQNVLFLPNGGNFINNVAVTLNTGALNATIYYTTNGDTPTQNSAVYNNQPLLLENSTTIKAVASVNNLLGKTTQALFTIAGPNVTISPSTTTHNDVFNCILTTDLGANIYYTLDGSTPTAASILYTNPFIVDSYITQINAIAIKNNNLGTVSTINYTINKPTLTISPNGIIAQKITAVSLICSLPNCTIYYTLDGSTPTKSSLVYTSPILINSTTNVKAYAVKGQLVTDIVDAIFDINLGSKPFTIYPNPAPNGQFTLRFNTAPLGVIQATFFNEVGKLLYKREITITNPVAQDETFNIPTLKVGNYYIKLRTISAQVGNLINTSIKLQVK